MKLRDKISWISWFTKTFSIFCFAIRKVLENICILKTNLLEISLWNSCVNGISTSVDTCNTLCRKCTLMRILYYIQTTLAVQAQGTWLRYARMRDMSKIYLAAILRRGYPRRIVRAIDASSIGAREDSQRVGASTAHYATLDACECTRARPTYVQQATRITGRARDGRARPM